jgi:hypothetical protein
MEVVGAVLQAVTIMVSVAALIASRVSRGKRFAERAEASLRLAASLSSTPIGIARKLPELDPTVALTAELSDDARVNTARYLQSGKGLGIRSPLIALGITYCLLFIAMGSIQVLNAQTASQQLGGAITIAFGAISGVLAVFGAINRDSEHRALRAAGLPVTTTWGELKEAGNSVRNRLVIRRLRGRQRSDSSSEAATAK